MKRFLAAILVAAALMLSGCVPTALHVRNATGTTIHVYSGHTKDMASIADQRAKEIPHTEGRLIIVTARDEVWKYPPVSVLGNSPEKRRLMLFWTKLVSTLEVDPQGKITIQESGRAVVPE